MPTTGLGVEWVPPHCRVAPMPTTPPAEPSPTPLRRWATQHPVRMVLLFVLLHWATNLVFSHIAMGGVTNAWVRPLAFEAFAAVPALWFIRALGGFRWAGFCRPSTGWWRAVLLAWPAVLMVFFEFLIPIEHAGYFRHHLRWLAFATAFAFLIGLCEECWYRGLMFTLLRQMGTTRAIAVSAAVFGLGHLMNLHARNAPFVVSQVWLAGALGVLYAALVVRTGSILPALLLHATYDLGRALTYGHFSLGRMGPHDTFLSVLEGAIPRIVAMAAVGGYAWSLVLLAPRPAELEGPQPEEPEGPEGESAEGA